MVERVTPGECQRLSKRFLVRRRQPDGGAALASPGTLLRPERIRVRLYELTLLIRRQLDHPESAVRMQAREDPAVDPEIIWAPSLTFVIASAMRRKSSPDMVGGVCVK